MIKNIVFDIGNVLLRWDPLSVVTRLFPEKDPSLLTQLMFKSSYWLDLNRGKLSIPQIIHIYHQSLNIDLIELNQLMDEVIQSLLPIDKAFDLLSTVHQAGYSLYALTDNVHEIMAYLKNKYDFWDKFNGIVVSAEIGYVKPSPEIYEYLIQSFKLNPKETLFIDDHLPNVEGAKNAGMYAIQFSNTDQCIHEMRAINIRLD